ncbi:hypothetical protein [Micromonospora chokoriensis]|nr:hypothetical protein [Micromonospora chokoriensis]
MPLIGLLDAVTAWGTRIGLQQRATDLDTAIDKSFTITAPMDEQPIR